MYTYCINISYARLIQKFFIEPPETHIKYLHLNVNLDHLYNHTKIC